MRTKQRGTGQTAGRARSPLRAAPPTPARGGPRALPEVRAFTMIEIAISLAIIGFALVAIIGILPTGLNVQRDNRQETMINQDESILMNALRNGERGLDDLPNYVLAITNSVTFYRLNGTAAGSQVRGYTHTVSTPVAGYLLTNGYNIVGLLGTPKFLLLDDGRYASNHVVATMRSISGPASEKSPQINPTIEDMAFTYRLISEVGPYGTNYYSQAWTNFTATGLLPGEALSRTNYFLRVKYFETNLHDLRLTFRWPILPNGSYGPGRQIYRTMASGPYTNDPPGSPFYFIQPNTYFKGS